jgi:hypothetical protein
MLGEPLPPREVLDRVCMALSATLRRQKFEGPMAVTALVSMAIALHKELGGSREALEKAFKAATKAVYEG